MSALSRRTLLAGGGVVVAFALTPRALGREAGGASGGGEGSGGPQKVRPDLPGDLAKFPWLDSWIRLGADGRVTVFAGKAELGQGIRTAFVQLAADELDVAPTAVTLVTPDTATTPDEGVTAGSHSMQDGGAAILDAAANVRTILLDAAAARWGLPAAALSVRDGVVLSGDSRRLGYGELAAGLDLHVEARPDAPRKPAEAQRLIGSNLGRLDIPGKLTGGRAYVQDLRPPSMLHARVVRGPSDGTRLKPADLEALVAGTGVRVARDGRFTALLHEREWPVVDALRRAQAAGWERPGPPLPTGDIHAALRALPTQDIPVFTYPGPPAPADARVIRARYTRPYLMHGSIGPSCAVARWADDGLTVWTHSQGVFPLRRALAELLRLPPERVRCIHAEGAGCYGHNGADDAAADAAVTARLVPGRPVRLQWSREQEHGWEPLGPAMEIELSAALDAQGRIAAWRHEVWSNEHNSRPTSAGGLLAGAELDPPFPPQEVKPIPMPEGGAARNSNPLYALPNAQGVFHWIKPAPVRVSALRSLGAHGNVFAIESFMDELARAAGRDPVAFRLDHLQDARAREVVGACAARFGWTERPRGDPGRGFGFAFARYKNLGGYCAVALELHVDGGTGRLAVERALAVVDAGEVVNPDGLANQVEGGLVQSLSWSTQEEVGLDAAHRTSFDWSAYPVLRFDGVPRRVHVHLLNRRGTPFLGVGECAQGPTAAALANALADAGPRLRRLPLSPERVKAGLALSACSPQADTPQRRNLDSPQDSDRHPARTNASLPGG